MLMKQWVSKHIFDIVVRTCFCELRQLKAIRNCIPLDTAKRLVNAFLVTRLDYCNSLLAGVPSYQLLPDLYAVHLDMTTSRLCSVMSFTGFVAESESLSSYVWWWNKSLHNEAPGHLQELGISQRSAMLPARARYASQHEHSSLNTTVGIWWSINCFSNKDKSWWTCFSVAGPRAWNRLPVTVKQLSSLSSFKRLYHLSNI